MWLLKLKFRRIFASDDALILVDIIGQAVQERRLARAGTPGNDDIAADAANDLQKLGTGRRNGAEADELVQRQLVLLEFTNGQDRSVDRKRRRDNVDT
jgi:hypothetical protein